MHVLSKSELGDIHEVIDSNQKLLPTALIRLLEEQFPHLNTETLYSIFNHRLRNKCAVSGKRLQDEKVAASLYHAFKTRVKDNHSNKVRKSVIPELATERGFFPWMAFRTVLMKHLEERDGQPPSKKALQSILRSPHLLRDVQLQLESIHCSVQDQLQGVVTDCLRHAVGRDYEVILEQRLKEANIAFLDEDAQRQAGQDVTPDFRLHVPIGVGGQPVCWIDSKALFGDAESHQNYLNTQLLSYWNRFGPGLVIYWCGYEENIEQLAPEVQVSFQLPPFEHFNP